MTKEDLIKELNYIHDTNSDSETAHEAADELLLSFINDKEIREAFDKIKKWYA